MHQDRQCWTKKSTGIFTTCSETWENLKSHKWTQADQSQTEIGIKLRGENINRIFKRNSEVNLKLFLMGHKSSAQQGQGHMLCLTHVKEERWIFLVGVQPWALCRAAIIHLTNCLDPIIFSRAGRNISSKWFSHQNTFSSNAARVLYIHWAHHRFYAQEDFFWSKIEFLIRKKFCCKENSSIVDVRKETPCQVFW